MEENRTAEGFLFLNEADAELARQEKKKVEYLEKHMDYRSAENVLRVYKKAILERVFRTPVGIEYLRRLQKGLTKCKEFEETDVPPIALYQTYELKMRDSYAPARRRVQPAAKKRTPWPVISTILNVVLALAVAGMFAITLKSDNPNILNYEKQIINKYASWDQELTEREQAVREKERQLQIEAGD